MPPDDARHPPSPPAPPTPAAGHLPALDGVRGVALLAVLVFHFVAHGPGAEAWPAWVRTASAAGWAGVDLFFVLSGFLITRILLAARGRPGAIRVFYARRALRIFPLYYAILAALTVGLLIAGRGRLAGDEPFNLAALWLYLTNFNVAAHGFEAAIFRQVQFAHLWTLAIEEQFYLVWPLLILLAPRRALLPACVGIIALTPAVRAMRLHAGDTATAVYVSTFCRADALAWGAAVALAAAAWPAECVRTVGRITLLIGLLVGAVVIALSRSVSEYGPLMQTAGYTAVAAACGGWIAVLITRTSSTTSVLTSDLLMTVGRYSYGAYLFHVPIRGVASAVWRSGLDRDPATLSLPLAAFTTIVMTAATIGMATLSFRYFERPILRHKPSLPSHEI